MMSYKLPYFLKIENGIINSVVDILINNDININNTLLISDEVIYDIYGKKVLEQISDNYNVSKRIIGKNSIQEVSDIVNFIINEDVTCIIGIGGGRPLDVSKYSASMTKRPFISIPTTLANDGLASPIAVLEDSNKKTKSLGCSVPSGIILDIDIIKSCPISLVKAGIGDTLSNLTAIYDWELDNRDNNGEINDFAKLLSSISVHSLINNNNKDIRSDEFIKLLSESLILSGMAMEIAGSSRPCSGSEHLFSHALDQINDEMKNLHGLQVALGAVISAYLQKQDYKKMIKYLRDYDIDVNPITLEIDRKKFINAFNFAKSTRPNRYTILNKINLDENEISNLYDVLCMEV